jgi:sporulation-control protein spo0M
MHFEDCKPVEPYPVVTELKVGDLVELRGRNRYNGARGILTQRNPDNGWFWFEATDQRNRHISGWREETWEDEECGTFRLVKVD